MKPKKVVVKFKDNTVLKGKTTDLFANKAQFHLEEMNGDIVEISIEDLKAVFFVKDFEGNKNRKDKYSDKIASGGRKIKVHFVDGETVVGYTLAYSLSPQGFFMVPADLQSNNERIFVVKSDTEKIKLL
jgi:hypothetical protein